MPQQSLCVYGSCLPVYQSCACAGVPASAIKTSARLMELMLAHHLAAIHSKAPLEGNRIIFPGKWEIARARAALRAGRRACPDWRDGPAPGARASRQGLGPLGQPPWLERADQALQGVADPWARRGDTGIPRSGSPRTRSRRSRVSCILACDLLSMTHSETRARLAD